MEQPRTRADIVMRIGGIVTVIGLVLTAIAMIPLFVPAVSLPSAMWFLSMLTGVGLAIVIAGLTMSALTRRRVR